MAGADRSGAGDELAALFPVLKLRATSVAGHLSGGERQMLALAMAFCMRPRVLLIDELSLGLAPAIITRLMESVRLFRDRSGVGILLVEQNVAAAAEVADRLYVLEAGRVASAGTRDDISLEILGGSPVAIS
jgi:branched-chain amino acid transport system ATP-binding protein